MKKIKNLILVSFAFCVIGFALGRVTSDNLRTIEANVNGLDSAGKSAQQSRILMEQASKGDLFAVKKAVEDGADVNFRDEYGWTPLIQAAVMNRFDVVKYLVLKGAQINVTAEDGTNALQHAVIYDHVAMVNFLLSRGADISLQGRYGWDALETAKRREREKVLKYFQHEKLVSH